jgi:hypothetical protein
MTTFKDSGQRTEFATGARRDIQEGKGRFDLLPFDALQEVAAVFEAGAKKYGDRNWEKGIPVRAFLSSAARHLFKAICGFTDEPHLPMAAWNLLCAIQTHVWVMNGERDVELGYDKALRLCRKFAKPEPVLADEVEVDDPIVTAMRDASDALAAQMVQDDHFNHIDERNGDKF